MIFKKASCTISQKKSAHCHCFSQYCLLKKTMFQPPKCIFIKTIMKLKHVKYYKTLLWTKNMKLCNFECMVLQICDN